MHWFVEWPFPSKRGWRRRARRRQKESFRTGRPSWGRTGVAAQWTGRFWHLWWTPPVTTCLNEDRRRWFGCGRRPERVVAKGVFVALIPSSPTVIIEIHLSEDLIRPLLWRGLVLWHLHHRWHHLVDGLTGEERGRGRKRGEMWLSGVEEKRKMNSKNCVIESQQQESKTANK